MLFSQTFYGLLLSYLNITDVTSYVDHTVHLTKSFLQTVLQMLLSQKNNSCTLCVPMFNLVNDILLRMLSSEVKIPSYMFREFYLIDKTLTPSKENAMFIITFFIIR